MKRTDLTDDHLVGLICHVHLTANSPSGETWREKEREREGERERERERPTEGETDRQTDSQRKVQYATFR